MPKKLIKRLLPTPESITGNKCLRPLNRWLGNPNLFHLNRRSAAGAFAVGLFFAFIPVPFQMLLAASGAVLFRVNLPLSVALVWVSNPLTMPPIFLFCYEIGAFVLRAPKKAFGFQLSWQWLEYAMVHLGLPFFVGCLICALFCSLAGYFTIRLLWWRMVVKSWQERVAKRTK